MTEVRLLVPVRDSVTLRNTVAYIFNDIFKEDISLTVHFVYPVSYRLTLQEDISEASDLLDKIGVWAKEDLEDKLDNVEIKKNIVGGEEYLFNPGDYADVLSRYADNNNLKTVLLDPEFTPTGMTPLLPPLETELERHGFEVEIAPVERVKRRPPLVHRSASFGQFIFLFGLVFIFYLMIGGSITLFNLVTGSITGVIVASLLFRISLKGPVKPKLLSMRILRMFVYIPLLFWQIFKANIHIAFVVLHPDLPIDPKIVEFDAAVWGEIPVTTLANSITLTPGTLTVKVTRGNFTVHTLTEESREGLFSGFLERAVRFVFYGRTSANIPSPAERNDIEGGQE